jgi:ribonucleoside-diphosphate reductase beta chain
MMENIHSETYSLLIDTYVRDEKDKLFNALEVFPAIKKKQTGLYNGSSLIHFAERLIAFAAVEGIFFQLLFHLLVKGN